MPNTAVSQGSFCALCGAVKCALGLEPTPFCGEILVGGQGCGVCYLCHLVAVFREVKRVLRKDGICWINEGSSYATGGYETHDKGAAGKQECPAGWAKSARGQSVGRTAGVSGLKAKDDCLIPQRLAIALQADGWWIRSMIPFVKRSAMPESVTDRPVNALEYIIMAARSKRYWYDGDAVRQNVDSMYIRKGTPLEKLIEPTKAGSAFCLRTTDKSGFQRDIITNGRAFRNTDLWFQSIESPHGLVGIGDELVGLDVTSDPVKYSHFAAFPRALVEPFVKCSTSERGCCPKCGAGWRRRVEKHATRPTVNMSTVRKMQRGKDPTCIYPIRYETSTTSLGFAPSCACGAGEPVPAVILDPFAGTCTSLAVARDLGRRSIGVECSEEYCKMGTTYRLLGAPYKPDDAPLVPVEAQAQLTMEEES